MWLGEMNNRITIVDSNPAVSVRPAALRPCFAQVWYLHQYRLDRIIIILISPAAWFVNQRFAASSPLVCRVERSSQANSHLHPVRLRLHGLPGYPLQTANP